MERKELVKHYIELMGSDAQESNSYKELALMTDEEIIDAIIHLAYYYKEEYNNA